MCGGDAGARQPRCHLERTDGRTEGSAGGTRPRARCGGFTTRGSGGRSDLPPAGPAAAKPRSRTRSAGAGSAERPAAAPPVRPPGPLRGVGSWGGGSPRNRPRLPRSPGANRSLRQRVLSRARLLVTGARFPGDPALNPGKGKIRISQFSRSRPRLDVTSGDGGVCGAVRWARPGPARGRGAGRDRTGLAWRAGGHGSTGSPAQAADCGWSELNQPSEAAGARR